MEVLFESQGRQGKSEGGAAGKAGKARLALTVKRVKKEKSGNITTTNLELQRKDRSLGKKLISVSVKYHYKLSAKEKRDAWIRLTPFGVFFFFLRRQRSCSLRLKLVHILGA